ncbi:hypothetical protein O1611_g4988 [Lasiodiplodia mahajangana]|uniref:Uncharacterized protein n=1 Tax=Lasiodiplodia mahajangana TaxID=1108764 RepID=A0ACC2JN77_9PEZI|nr:hypothetical protein O1611_g4988 [Lasiodiplodia mahajangana]
MSCPAMDNTESFTEKATCIHYGLAGHQPAKCWRRPAKEGAVSLSGSGCRTKCIGMLLGLQVILLNEGPVQNSPAYWCNKRDNYLAAAAIKEQETDSLKAQHQQLCSEASAAEKKAKAAEEKGVLMHEKLLAEGED